MKPVAAIGLMAAAILLFGAVLPRNPGWTQPPQGVEIGIDATLAHTELILPVAAGGHDWRTILPPGVVGPDTTHLAFSWGERRFFLATPTWADLDPWLGLRALVAGDESLVHIYRLRAAHGRPIRLSPQSYRALAAHLAAEIAAGPALPGYGADDSFLPGTTRYSALRTCNQWTADALAAAGVRTSLFTPFAQGLMWRYPEAGSPANGPDGRGGG